MFNHLFQFNLATPNEGFKAIRKLAYEKLELNADGFDFDLELLVKAKAAGCRVSEVPITIRKRRYGKSKVRTIKVSLGFLNRMIRLWLGQKIGKWRSPST